MKYVKPIATYADLLVLALVVTLNPLSPFTPYHFHQPPHIPDKVEIYYRHPLSTDTITQAIQKVEAEMAEMQYYLRVHNVDDDGYNLVALYHQALQQEQYALLRQEKHSLLSQQKQTSQQHRAITMKRTISASQRPMIAVKTLGGYWKAGQFHVGYLKGKGIVRDFKGRIVSAEWDADTIVKAVRIDDTGIYRGQMDHYYLACGQGTMDEWDGCHKEGFWRDDRLHGFAFDSSPNHQLRIGEWKDGQYKGERMKYTTERIYGIDISRHQHEKGRRRYGINWKKLRITSLGRRHQAEGRTFPVSFVYIKATEGTNIRNRYYRSDYLQAVRTGIHVGAYHFFSIKSTAEEQASFFLSNAGIRKSDFPPVLDVEPTEGQIKQIGGDEELMRRIRVWMQIVERRTGKRPILYVSQMFVNRHMANAPDIKEKYNIWIARYGQYRPDVKLVYWQLCADGRVDGITGDVDVNVFNGYQGQFDEFVRTGMHR
jgi:lysozyme